MTTPHNQISYKELQRKLKVYKEQGLTEIKLNSKKSVLLAELARIESRLDLQAAPVNSVESTSSITASEGEVGKASVEEDSRFEVSEFTVEAEISKLEWGSTAEVKDNLVSSNMNSKKKMVGLDLEPESVSEEFKEVEEILTAHQDQQQQLPISSSDSVAGSKEQASHSTWLESLQEKVIWWIEGFRPYSSRFSFTSRLS